VSAESRYRETLSNPVQPGDGCHSWIMSTANLGVRAGNDPQAIHVDIKGAIIPGRRRISDKEISDAIQKAVRDHSGGNYIPQPRPEPAAKDGKRTLRNLLNQAKIKDEADLFEASPARLWNPPEEDPILFLQTVFESEDLIWIGEAYAAGIIGQTIRHRDEWISYFQKGGQTFPHIIINPLDGLQKPRRGDPDETTLRGDQNVKIFRHVLIEFDDLSREDQIRFWSVIKLPVVALIDTGGKSIHGWIDVQKLAEVTSEDLWNLQIRMNLFDHLLTPLGVDAACKNPARLSRLPGHFRAEKGKFQRLLWLSTEGFSIDA